MKTILFACMLAASLSAPVHAEDSGAKPRITQQQRMKDCNAEAKGKALKGDERRSFMSSCLKGHAAASAGGGTDKQAARLK